MEQDILNELIEIKNLLRDSNFEQEGDCAIRMLATIENRIYSIEENIKWINNNGRYICDAGGPAGIPGL